MTLWETIVSEMEKKEYDYDSISPGYYDEVFHRRRGVQSKWHALKFRLVGQCLGDEYSHHLDIGCGPGTFVGTLPADLRSTGTDIASTQIDFANEHYKTEFHDFQCVPPGKVPFDDATFDVVTLVELIEHLEMADIEFLIGEAHRVLDPGGKIVITTPNYASLWPLLEKAVNRLGEVSYEDQHLTFFNRGRLRALLQRLGFTNIRVTTFHGVAPFCSALSGSLADVMQKVETPLLCWGMGFLLLGVGFKSTTS